LRRLVQGLIETLKPFVVAEDIIIILFANDTNATYWIFNEEAISVARSNQFGRSSKVATSVWSAFLN
jgi:hypothetical protein